MRVSVVSLHPLWPGNGGNARTHALTRSLVELGHEVQCIFPASASDPERVECEPAISYVPLRVPPLGHRNWPRWIRRTKRALAPLPSEIGARTSSFATALRSGHRPDVVVLPGAYGRHLVGVVPGAATWIDFHDAMSRCAVVEARYLRGVSRSSARLQAVSMRRGERRALRVASVATAAGRTDATFLAGLGSTDVTWLPTPIAVDEPAPPDPGTGRIGLLGSFAYAPNRDAAWLLAGRWMRPLRAAGWEVVVAGRDSGDLRLPVAIHRMGELDHVRDFYESVSAVVVPMRRGGGMKVKVVEALGYGRPVIGTSFAFEGFADLPAITVVDEDDPAIPAHLEPPSPDEVAAIRRDYGTHAFTAGVARVLEGLS